jgi:AcrR family transcriptional regulator
MKKISYDDKVDAVLCIIEEHGLSFKMDDLANRLEISKRTLYKKIPSKEDAITLLIEHVFKEIKLTQKVILESNQSSLEKARGLMGVVPTSHTLLHSSNMEELSKNFPKLYHYTRDLLESDWDVTFDLLDDAISKGEVRPFDKDIFKHMYVSAMTLINHEHKTSYEETLNQTLNILFNGIVEGKQ